MSQMPRARRLIEQLLPEDAPATQQDVANAEAYESDGTSESTINDHADNAMHHGVLSCKSACYFVPNTNRASRFLGDFRRRSAGPITRILGAQVGCNVSNGPERRSGWVKSRGPSLQMLRGPDLDLNNMFPSYCRAASPTRTHASTYLSRRSLILSPSLNLSLSAFLT